MTTKKLQVAVLDDCQNAARDSGPWSRLADSAVITVFSDHLTDVAEAHGPNCQRTCARTGWPGSAPVSIAALRTTGMPFTRTCRMPAGGRVLSL